MKFFKRKNKRENYILRLENILFSNKSIICIFSEKGGITPLRVNMEEIFSNINILKSIHPEVLFTLRKIYDMDISKNKVKVSAILNENKYEIIYRNKFKINISGSDLCKDLELLSLMSIKDSFNIIYNTAFNNALSAYITSSKLKNEEGVIAKIEKKNPREKLTLIK